MDLNLTNSQTPIVVSVDLVAENNRNYTVIENATFTDPTPEEGKGFKVFVRNGTAIIGGDSFAEGSFIFRIYYDGAFLNVQIDQTLAQTLERGNETFSNDIILTELDRIVVGANRAGLSKGTFDTSRGGDKGVSLHCIVGYELNFQAGFLRMFLPEGDGTPLPINSDSEIIYTELVPTTPTTGTSLITKDYADTKEPALGFTPEDIENKKIDLTDNSDTFYPTQKAVKTALDLKVDAVAGKGLSANDFTNTLKTKLDGIEDGAQVNVNADWNATSGDAQILNKPTIPATIGDMTKAVYDPNNTGIVLTASKEMVAVINKTGATIVKGSIVYLKSSSSSGTHPEILLADADTEATSSKTLGATYEDILNDAVGYVVTSGEVDNLNTTAYNIGDKLWLSQTAGQVTTTPPTQPAHTVFIGTVTRSQNTNGRVLYAIQNGYELGELHDVLLTSPANNDALVYESSSSLWKNKPILTGLGWFKTVDTTNSTPVTGTSETFLSATQLPTLASGSLLKINCLRLTKGIVAVSTIKGYINNVNNNLTGAVQIFSTASAFAQNSRIGTLLRTFKIVSGNIIGMSNATGLFTDNGANSSAVLNSALPSGTLYLIITAQNNLTGESTVQEILDISNF